MLVSYLELKRRIRHPWPFQRMAPVSTNKRFLRRVKQGALQFVLIKPLTAILGLILDRYGLYKDGELSLTTGYFYCAFINNISVTVRAPLIVDLTVLSGVLLRGDLGAARALPTIPEVHLHQGSDLLLVLAGVPIRDHH